MGLPSPQQLEDLAKLIKGEEVRNKIGFWPEADQRRELARLRDGAPPQVNKPLSDKAGTWARKGVQVAVSKGIPAAGNAAFHGGIRLTETVNLAGHAVSVGTTLAPMGAVFSAWISMATVAVQAGKVFDLYTLRDDARSHRHSATTYSCDCGRCADNIQYIIDKKERNVGIVAVSVATVGIVGLGKILHSVGKKLKSKIMGETRPKERVCREMVESGRNGCLAAMGAIFLLSGSWTQGYRDQKTMEAAVLTLTAKDGWDKFKDNW
ncbi:hypothetical protein ABLE91_20530 [Aquabacter sp. CN5-332]|uniref:hypothetical protein n=1 Tax=Aquabacter sp. CN5-332 TaxID=3156608 RepID=UPI0032B4494B